MAEQRVHRRRRQVRVKVREVWRRERNSGRFGSGRKFITSVKVETVDGGEPRVVVDAYSVGGPRGVGPGSRATWFTGAEWGEINRAVRKELLEDFLEQELLEDFLELGRTTKREVTIASRNNLAGGK